MPRSLAWSHASAEKLSTQSDAYSSSSSAATDVGLGVGAHVLPSLAHVFAQLFWYHL